MPSPQVLASILRAIAVVAVEPAETMLGMIEDLDVAGMIEDLDVTGTIEGDDPAERVTLSVIRPLPQRLALPLRRSSQEKSQASFSVR
jgi:hypothetical protein